MEKEDFDEYLDGILDDFDGVSVAHTNDSAVSSAATEQHAQQKENVAKFNSQDESFEAEFLKTLEANMESMLKDGNLELPEQFKNAAELASEKNAAQPSERKAGNIKNARKNSIHSAINSTIEKLQSSSSAAEQEASSESMQDFGDISSMMKEFESLMESGELDNVMSSVFDQFVSRDLLYEPLKDLSSKYPEWIDKNVDKTGATDLARYRAQHECILEILHVYDANPENEQLNEENSRKITDLMQKMQDYGYPPNDLFPMDEENNDIFSNLKNPMEGLPENGCLLQ